MKKSRLGLARNCWVVSETTFDSAGKRTLTEAFVGAIAEAEGVDPTELPPLSESVDFDALTQLINRPDATTDSGLTTVLRVGKWKVFVSANGRIRVCNPTIEIDPEPLFKSDATSR